MAPLGVKVITVMTGIVGTNIFVNHPDPKIPEDSYWKPASKEITDTASGVLTENCMPASAFAKRVADDVLGGATGLTWRGKMASIAWFLQTFLPTWLLVSYSFEQFDSDTDQGVGPRFDLGDWDRATGVIPGAKEGVTTMYINIIAEGTSTTNFEFVSPSFLRGTMIF